MKKLILLSILLIVGCDEFSINEQQISNGTAVTDTLYISNDTTIYIGTDTLIIVYDTTIYFDTTIYIDADTLVLIDTVYINSIDCDGVEGGTSILDCFGVCGGEAAIDSCGLCTGGTTGLEINYLMDCAGVCNGDAVEDNCGTCDNDSSNDCDESTTDDTSVGALVGTWELSALTGTYIRDVAQPTDSDPTSYALTASWNYAAAVMGNDSAKADQTISAFSVGDTVLNKTSALPSAAYLTAAGVAMTGVFNDQDIYTLTGTYPTIRLDEDACNSYQTVAQITDQGYYGVVYNADNTGGTFTVAPDASLGDQVLPPFDDATVTFTNDGNTLNIQFEDRDSHDVDYAEVMTEWSETDDRVTMGIAQLPIDPTTGAFTAEESNSLNSSGYLMSAVLATWGGYMTWNALQYNGCLAHDAAAGGDGTSCQTSHAAYLVNDSENVFDISCMADGDPIDCAGKLTYIINAQCIPVNEIILFDATFERQ